MKSPQSGSQTAPRRDFFAEITQQIITRLEQGSVPWIRPWSDRPGTLECPVNPQGRPYRGINRVLLGMEQTRQGYDSPQWFTRKMANVAGGHIRKGEKGTPIVFFRPVEKRLEADSSGDTAPPATEETVRRFWVHRFYYVWNRDQLEKVDGAPPPVRIERGSEAFRQARSDQLVQGAGADILLGGNRAYYSVADDCIRLPSPEQFADPAAFHGTRFHELVHWTGHAARLARQYGRRFADQAYAREELVAEMGAAFLCDWAGLQAELQHPAYMASWLEVLKSDSSAIIVAASHAQKAFDFLLEQAGLTAGTRPVPDPA